MELVKFKEADSVEPEEGWHRISIAGKKHLSIEYFEKPPGHSSPLHAHDNRQVTIVVKGKMKVTTNEDEVVLKEMDSVFFDKNEPHRIENVGKEKAIGIDIFVPERTFDFWLKWSE